MKRLLYIVVLLILVSGAYIAYPYWTLHRIETALINQDVVALETLFDWQQLRAGLKGDVRRVIIGKFGETSSAPADSVGAMLGLALGSTVIDSMIAAGVSEAGLLEVWRKGQLPQGKQTHDFVASAWFQSLTTFRVETRNPDDRQSPTVTFLMEFARAEWRVTRVVLPWEAFQAAAQAASQTKGDRKR